MEKFKAHKSQKCEQRCPLPNACVSEGMGSRAAVSRNADSHTDVNNVDDNARCRNENDNNSNNQPKERWSESCMDNTTSLPQLCSIRHRLKLLLEWVETKIGNELSKKVLEEFELGEVNDDDANADGGGYANGIADENAGRELLFITAQKEAGCTLRRLADNDSSDIATNNDKLRDPFAGNPTAANIVKRCVKYANVNAV